MNRHDLMKRDPFKEIREWERRLFNDPFFAPSLLEKDYWGEIMHTPSELTEDEKHYHLAIELPGMDKEKINIRFFIFLWLVILNYRYQSPMIIILYRQLSWIKFSFIIS